MLGMLAKRFPRLEEDERLAVYHDCWTRVLSKRERGEKIVSLRAYLMATAGAEALNLVSRGRVPTPIGPDDPRLATLSDDAPPLDEQVVTRDQARIARNLLETLDERQRDVLKLRWDLQLSGPEVQAALGLTQRQYRRLAEEGAAALADRIEELESGQWSRRTRSLLVACLIEVTRDDGERRVGIASRRQRAEAQRLLDSDPHVAALYAEVRRSIRGAAALLPLPALAFAPPAGVLGHLAELASGFRAHVESAGQAAKQQATSLYLRAADPALLTGGPRPGAAVAAIAGAVALGGGAYGTYQATSPNPPASAAPPAIQATQAAAPPRTPISPPSPKRTPARRPDSQATPPPPPTPDPIAPSPTPQPTPAQPPPTPTQPSQPTEFGFED